MQKISPTIANEKLKNECENICFIDVRTEDEYRAGHIPGTVCIPLDRIELDQANIPKDKLVIVSCQSGIRSAKAKAILIKRGYSNIIEMEGGYSAWSKAGLPTNKISKTIPIIRQVMIVAGSSVLVGSLLGLFVHSGFFVIPVFFGAGLAFAGITGWCGLAFVLEKMPWNQKFSN